MPRSIYRQINRVMVGVACLTALVLSSPLAHAQQGRAQIRAQQRAAKADTAAVQRFFHINLMLVQLSLTADQRTRIIALQSDAEHKIAALLLDRTLAPAARKAQIRAMTQGALAQTRTLLGPMQKRRLNTLTRLAREQRQAATAVTASGTMPASSPSVVTADGEEIQF